MKRSCNGPISLRSLGEARYDSKALAQRDGCRLYSDGRAICINAYEAANGAGAAAQPNRRYRACRGPPDRHDLTPSICVDWPLRPRDSRMGHHLCGVTGKPSRRSGRQGPYFRSSGLARDDDLLHALGRPWLIRAVARASGDGGDACSSPCLRCGSGRGLRLARHQTELGRQLFPAERCQSDCVSRIRTMAVVRMGCAESVTALSLSANVRRTTMRYIRDCFILMTLAG